MKHGWAWQRVFGASNPIPSVFHLLPQRLLKSFCGQDNILLMCSLWNVVSNDHKNVIFPKIKVHRSCPSQFYLVTPLGSAPAPRACERSAVCLNLLLDGSREGWSLLICFTCRASLLDAQYIWAPLASQDYLYLLGPSRSGLFLDSLLGLPSGQVFHISRHYPYVIPKNICIVQYCWFRNTQGVCYMISHPNGRLTDWLTRTPYPRWWGSQRKEEL